jgi:transposase InsO family protein
MEGSTMGQVLHGSATTTEAVRRSIQHIQESLRALAKRYGINPKTVAKKKFKVYPIGFFHIDIAEVQTAEGRLYLFVAIDRTSKFAFVELHSKAARRVAADFLRNLADAVPYKINTILTDNGTHVTDPGGGWSVSDIKAMRAEGVLFRCHSFDAACADLDIEHRLKKPAHPWTNGQAERMNRTIKEATVKRYHDEDHAQFRQHLDHFIAAGNFGRRLKTLKGLTPYEFICKQWTKEPERFRFNPIHQMPRLNS